MKKNSLTLIVFFSSIANVLFLTIDYPSWDDWVLTNLPFDTIADQFKMNGLYYTFIPLVHNIINIIGSNNYIIIRLISVLLITIWPILFYKLLVDIRIPETTALFISLISGTLPVFANSFSQIVMPYLICLNLFLTSLILFNNYISNQKKLILILALLLLIISYTTQSLYFFVYPALIVILIIKKQRIINSKKNLYYIIAGVLLSSVLFYLYKSFVLNPNGIYSEYNRLTLNGLLITGPVNTIKTVYKIFIEIYHYSLKVLMEPFNYIIIGLIFTLSLISFRKLEISTSCRFCISILISGILLLLAGIYPYAVVNKTPEELVSWSQRHSLLVPFGMSLIIYSLIDLVLRNQLLKKIILSITISLFITIKIFIIAHYHYNASLQKDFAEEFIQNFNDIGSTLYIIEQDPKHDIYNWRFYEFGGIMRMNELEQNKLFLFKNNPQLEYNTDGVLEISNSIDEYIKYKYYGISTFNTNDYNCKKIKLVYNKEITIKAYILNLLTKEELQRSLIKIVEVNTLRNE